MLLDQFQQAALAEQAMFAAQVLEDLDAYEFDDEDLEALALMPEEGF